MRGNPLAYLMIGLLLSSCQLVAKTPGQSPRFKKVMLVILENTDFEKAYKEKALVEFAKKGALLRNYHGITHPSQSNYLALVAGQIFVRNNNPVDLDASHLADLLEARGMSWKTYAEGFPGNCFLGATRGKYARKHNPFISFINIQRVPQRCQRIVAAEELDKDIESGQLPDFSLYIPDADNSGHDTGVSYAARWFDDRFGRLLKMPEFSKDFLLILTFDEGSYWRNNRVYTALVGAGIKVGAESDINYDHYSLLRTLENEWDLGSLGQKDASAKPIVDIWQ